MFILLMQFPPNKETILTTRTADKAFVVSTPAVSPEVAYEVTMLGALLKFPVLYVVLSLSFRQITYDARV